MKIEIFGMPLDKVVCPNCMKVKELCEKHDLVYTYLPVLDDVVQGRGVYNIKNVIDIRDRLKWKDTDPISVPQVFIDGIAIGGLGGFRNFIRDLFKDNVNVV